MRTWLMLLLLVCTGSAFAQDFFLLVGTYTSSGSKGIYVYNFNAATGKATWLSNTEGVVNPSYLAIAPNHQFVYAVTETATANAGSVSAFAFDKQTGKLTFLNKQSSGGDNPCYVSVHKSNKWIVIGNYSGGSLAALPINKDGSLLPYAQHVQHTGSSVNKQRQDKAHVHSTVFSPGNKYLFTPDLGLDKVFIYRFKASAKLPLTAATPAFAATEPGSGPRHFTFHPNKKFAYLVEEMSGYVSSFSYREGQLTLIQRINAHPANYSGKIGSADIHLSPDGRFLYASNRGDANTIASFAVNSNGTLKALQYDSTLGKTPRNFIIDPTGNYLLVANQTTNNIVVFKRDKTTGALTPTGEEIKVPTPVCLQMMKR